MYDRALLQAVASDKGDRHYTDLATRLKVAPATAWRLWTGKTRPSVQVAVAVEDAYGLSLSHLLKLTPADPVKAAA